MSLRSACGSVCVDCSFSIIGALLSLWLVCWCLWVAVASVLLVYRFSLCLSSISWRRERMRFCALLESLLSIGSMTRAFRKSSVMDLWIGGLVRFDVEV